MHKFWFSLSLVAALLGVITYPRNATSGSVVLREPLLVSPPPAVSEPVRREELHPEPAQSIPPPTVPEPQMPAISPTREAGKSAVVSSTAVRSPDSDVPEASYVRPDTSEPVPYGTERFVARIKKTNDWFDTGIPLITGTSVGIILLSKNLPSLDVFDLTFDSYLISQAYKPCPDDFTAICKSTPQESLRRLSATDLMFSDNAYFPRRGTGSLYYTAPTSFRTTLKIKVVADLPYVDLQFSWRLDGVNMSEADMNDYIVSQGWANSTLNQIRRRHQRIVKK